MRALIVWAACLSPLVFIALLTRAPLTGLAIMAATHLLLVYATLRPNVQWLGPVVTGFATDKEEVWLTIDDGPAEDTPALLDVLDRHRARATFFVKGALTRQRPDLVRAIAERGHSVANHSDTHPSATFWCLPPGAIAREIDGCNEALLHVTGHAPIWFRAPVGMKNPAVHPLLSSRGMRLIGWSARGFDGVGSEPAAVTSRITRETRAGSIVLLHQGRPRSAEIIDSVLTALESRGYSFVVPADERLTATGAR